MTEIKRRIQSLEDKLDIGEKPIEIVVNLQFLGDKETQIIRIKYLPDGTVERREEVGEWQEGNIHEKAD
jgi:hypothetical protein